MTSKICPPGAEARAASAAASVADASNANFQLPAKALSGVAIGPGFVGSTPKSGWHSSTEPA